MKGILDSKADAHGLCPSNGEADLGPSVVWLANPELSS